MKSKLHGQSTHSHSSSTLKSQPPSKPKKSTNIPPKTSQSFYQQIYRLPSSMKRTEEMISKSILKQHISSRILDLVGNTFRVKNAIQSQVTFPTRAPINRPRPSYSRDHSSSRILEVLYEEEGEDEEEEVCSTVVNSTDRNNLSVRGAGNDYLEKSTIMNKSVGMIKVHPVTNNSSASMKNLQKIVACGNKNNNLQKHWERHDRNNNSVSPGRRDIVVKSDVRTVKPAPRKSVEKPSRLKSEEKKAVLNKSNNAISEKKISVMKELKKAFNKGEKERAWEGRLLSHKSKENENNTKAIQSTKEKGQIMSMNEKKILQARGQSQERKVIKEEIIKEEDEGLNMPRAVQKEYYSSVSSGQMEISYKCQTEESTKEEIIKQTRDALEKVLAPRVSKEENMKFSIYKSINDFEKKLSGHAMMRYNNLRKCLDSSELWHDKDDDDEEEYRIKKVINDF